MMLDLTLLDRIKVDAAYERMLRHPDALTAAGPVNDPEAFIERSMFDAVILRLYDKHGEVVGERIPEGSKSNWKHSDKTRVPKQINPKREGTTAYAEPTSSTYYTTSSSLYSVRKSQLDPMMQDVFWDDPSDRLTLMRAHTHVVLDGASRSLTAIRPWVLYPKVTVGLLVYAPYDEKMDPQFRYAIDPADKNEAYRAMLMRQPALSPDAFTNWNTTLP